MHILGLIGSDQLCELPTIRGFLVNSRVMLGSLNLIYINFYLLCIAFSPIVGNRL